ncbi:hypothetical protein [Salinibacterium sp. ZJ454]|uniref:hypothetical protein n=1 Tax=Salinibacterium sp. ZJ454 TaxID=2708339 RepID=UPI00142357AD|nr:hypothetical protein [Salinibacterium sp. ZJ454]
MSASPSLRRLATLSGVILLTGALLTACATPAAQPSDDGPGAAPSGHSAAAGEVIGQGTVLQVEPDAAQLCLGGVMESYPPQCSGPDIVGWDWAAVEYEESSGGVTWGTYAVQGTWDGEIFTLTQPAIPLALYDPMADIDPRTLPENAGSATEPELEAIQQQLIDEASVDVLMTWPENGYLFVTVVHDDGALQGYFDERFGPDVIAVGSALKPVS